MEQSTARPVSVSRRIPAPAEAIFAVLSDPTKHPELDGSEMVQYAVSTAPVTAAGDTFTVAMLSRFKGRYEIVNHVVEFEPGRRIAWEPQAGDGLPEAGTRMGHRWTYDLQPDGPAVTVVTETYDCSRIPAEEQQKMSYGEMWREAMATTLARLEALCAAREA